MNKIKEFLDYSLHIGHNIEVSIQSILIEIVIFCIVALLFWFIRVGVTRKLPKEHKGRFITIFSYLKYFTFFVIILISLSNLGVKITAILTGAAALLIGVGLALQTFFQDIISGVFILIDQSLRIGDVIEIDGKIGRVTRINLRSTRAVTVENKVMIIPNHLYLTHTLYNYTQNEDVTRESVSVGVAYGSDVQKVEELLLKAAENVKEVLQKPVPSVRFENFGESSLDFKLVFTVRDSFRTLQVCSEIRFEIDRLFRENDITIPFPQRDVNLRSN